MSDYWVIRTYDGGFDFLQPGRWVACVPGECRNWGMAHGKTEIEAVENFRNIIREKDPNMLWMHNMRYERGA